ncbi:MAG TPA: hypothetical protein VLY45_01430 [Nitrospiria bacterium]|nr:hypothetical protein [Nitrospiria bacterium]
MKDSDPATQSRQDDGRDDRRRSAIVNRTGRITFGTVVFFGLVAGAIYLAVEYLPPWMAYRAMLEVMQEQVGAAAVSSDDEIIDRIMATAKEWQVPVAREQIIITRTDARLSISAQWDATVTLFGGRFQQTLHFAPSTESTALPANR